VFLKNAKKIRTEMIAMTLDCPVVKSDCAFLCSVQVNVPLFFMRYEIDDHLFTGIKNRLHK